VSLATEYSLEMLSGFCACKVRMASVCTTDVSCWFY